MHATISLVVWGSADQLPRSYLLWETLKRWQPAESPQQQVLQLQQATILHASDFTLSRQWWAPYGSSRARLLLA